MDKFCHSCSAPLGLPGFKSAAENYCIYCTDSSGNLKPAEEIKADLAQWFKDWQPELSDNNALVRAEKFMQSMPAWAD